MTLSPVPIDDLPPINNDHVVDAPRGLIYLSANDGHLYVAPIAGGTATRISHDPTRYHFLHGVSPDGSTLAFVDLPRGDFSAAGRFSLIPAAGGETTYPEAGSRHIDGPEYSADGAWIYLNTEEFGTQPGPRPARPRPRHRRRPRAARRLRHRRLVPTPVTGRDPRHVHQLPDRHPRAPRRPRRRDPRRRTPTTGLSRCGRSRCSAARAPSTSTAGHPTDAGSPTSPTRTANDD